MAHTFGQALEIGLALPFVNLSFQHWEDTLPDQWVYVETSPSGTHGKDRGFDLTPSLKITDTGQITSTPDNRLQQEILLPDWIENGQHVRGGGCFFNNYGSPYGISQTVVKLTQNSGAVSVINNGYSNATSWAIHTFNDLIALSTSYTDLIIGLELRSYNPGTPETDPAGAWDCLFFEVGRTIASRYDTLTHFPEFHPNLIESFSPGRKSERGGRGKRRSYDRMGGAVKWRVTLPFVNVPASFVEILEEYYIHNKGLDNQTRKPLVLHHHLTDPSAAHTAGHQYLKTPPWIICDIVEEKWPFRPSGAYLGAGMYSGTLTFEEI
jgi:hypothetical protein